MFGQTNGKNKNESFLKKTRTKLRQKKKTIGPI